MPLPLLALVAAGALGTSAAVYTAYKVVTPSANDLAIAKAAKAAGMTPEAYKKAIGNISKGTAAQAQKGAIDLQQKAKDAGMSVPQYLVAIAKISRAANRQTSALHIVNSSNILAHQNLLAQIPQAPQLSTAFDSIPHPNWLPAGSSLDLTLMGRDRLDSANGRGSLVLQSDGNMVLRDWWRTGPNSVLWTTATQGRPLVRATMQSDGNFVLYDQANDSNDSWATATNGYAGAYIVLQDDGNLVIYLGDKPIWATNTDGWRGSERADKTVWDIPSEFAGMIDDSVNAINGEIRKMPLGIGAVTSSLEDDVKDFANTKAGGIICTALATVAIAIIMFFTGLAGAASYGPLIAAISASPAILKGQPLAEAYAKALLETATIYVSMAVKAYASDAASEAGDVLVQNIPIPKEVADLINEITEDINNIAQFAGKLPYKMPDDPQIMMNGLGAQLGLPVPTDVETLSALYGQKYNIPKTLAHSILATTTGLPPPPSLVKGYDQYGNMIVDKFQAGM